MAREYKFAFFLMVIAVAVSGCCGNQVRKTKDSGFYNQGPYVPSNSTTTSSSSDSDEVARLREQLAAESNARAQAEADRAAAQSRLDEAVSSASTSSEYMKKSSSEAPLK